MRFVYALVLLLPTAVRCETTGSAFSNKTQLPLFIVAQSTSIAQVRTGTGNSPSINAYGGPVSEFAIQVKGVGAAATAWNVVLEGSLNGVQYTTILTHTNASGDGATLYSGAALSPSLFIRSRVVSLTLGTATAITVSILGMN